MVCVTYTAPVPVAPVLPTVSNLRILGILGTSGIRLEWFQDNAGSVKIYVDGALFQTFPGVYGFNQVSVLPDLTVNHQICVE